MKTVLLIFASLFLSFFAYMIGYAACAQQLVKRFNKADELAEIAKRLANGGPDGTPTIIEIKKTIEEYEATKYE